MPYNAYIVQHQPTSVGKNQIFAVQVQHDFERLANATQTHLGP